MKTVAVLAIALMLGWVRSEDPAAAAAVATGAEAATGPAARVAPADPGCYRLEVGSWRPALEPDRTPIFRLPDRVVLEAVRVAGGEGARFLLRATRPELQRTGRAVQAYWTVRDDGTLGLHWTTGAVGVDIELRGTGGGRYIGSARAWSHAGSPGRSGATASVVARRQDCGR